MNNSYFENFSEEIESLISNTQRDNNIVHFNLQHGKEVNIVFFNNVLEKCTFDLIRKIDIQMITSEGYYIQGSSDRMYMNDVITRLYNSLNNLLKANKDHRVKKDISRDILNITSKKQEIYNEFEDWDTEFLTQFVNELYFSITEEYKQKLNIKLELKGNYSKCLSGISNTEDKNYIDSFNLNLICSIYHKENALNKYTISKNINFENFLNKDLDLNNELNLDIKQLNII